MFPSPSVTWTVRQNQMTNGNEAEEYFRAGGLAHFQRNATYLTACRNIVGVGVRKWKDVNCISCLRLHADLKKKAA